ncbi:MAG: hypothetical protein A3F17_06095 [Gammaproteobacteria bacterium RIFCSPHIGHO2_12_FULL_41_15]|nr:MAG: hypothetical protein A3F17_06095 [Gammaproteobacteria bacterium RIFCSPHIGHO2_12_FULL_41_15]
MIHYFPTKLATHRIEKLNRISALDYEKQLQKARVERWGCDPSKETMAVILAYTDSYKVLDPLIKSVLSAPRGTTPKF